MSTIPASSIVSVNPSVINAGGAGLDLSGLMLTTSTRVPIGAVLAFPSTTGVSAYFGASSAETSSAAIYFAGFNGSNIKPATLLFAQYNQTPVPAYVRGGNVSALLLTQLQALSGSLSAVVDGYTRTAASVNFSAASSFSAAAVLMQTGLNASPPQAATCSLGTIASTTLTVAGTVTGIFAVGQTITGSGVTANSVITALGTGTGGIGTYTLSQSSTVGSGAAMTASGTNVAVTYDSVAGAFLITSGITGTASTTVFATGTLAAGVKLTSATGAILSQGAAANTPAALMGSVINQTTNFASFMTIADPDAGSGNTLKQAFAAWNGLQNKRYVYVVSDTDVTPTLSTAATGSLGYILKNNATEGSIVIYDTSALPLAPFVCGMIASLDFTELNGRATFAFKSQSGLTVSVTDQTTQSNLLANGYNFYGAFATANQGFVFLSPGSITGTFMWADSYVNQIWLNSQFQLSLMELLTQVKSVPYNSVGYGLIRSACTTVITQAVEFGAIQPGVNLSDLQAAEVNSAAGLKIDQTLFSQGWYLQILPASPQSRGLRKTPPMTFWYMDGGSVQQVSLASIEVQ